MICILTVSYNQAFIDPELELLYDKDIQLNQWNFNGSTILPTLYALPYISIKHSLHKLYKCMLLYLGLYIRGINLLFM